MSEEMQWMRKIALGCMVVASVALFAACRVGVPHRADSLRGAVTVSASQGVLVLPLRVGSPLPVYGNHVMCHLTGEHLEIGTVPGQAGLEIAEAFVIQLGALGAAVTRS